METPFHNIRDLSCTLMPPYSRQHSRFVGSEVLRAVAMKSSVLWDIKLCSPLKVRRRFGETCHLHLQGKKKSKQGNSMKQVGGICFLPTSCWFLLRPCRLRWHVPSKRHLTFNGLHSVISLTIELFVCVSYSGFESKFGDGLTENV
jgi:hypothetical protein